MSKLVDQAQDVDVQEANPNLITKDQTTELDMVNDIAVFATSIVNWHTHIANQTQHVLNMPEQQEGDDTYIGVFVRCDSNHPDYDAERGMRQLRMSELPAFKAGVRYFHDLFVELPFKFVPTDADGNVLPEYESGVDAGDETQAEQPST